MLKIENLSKFSKKKSFFLLHFAMILYSFIAVLSKQAGKYDLYSPSFVLSMTGVLLLMAIYAFLWQLTLKKIPISVAFANKSIVILWGIIWGKIFFNEQLHFNMLIGAAVIIIGIFLVVSDDD